MKNRNAVSAAAALGVSLVFAMGAATAAGITDESYSSLKDNIEATYKADKQKCDAMSGNEKDVCVTAAKGKEKVAKAKLEAERNPTAKAQYEVAVAQAEADYDVAKEKCDASSGDAKNTCEQAAKDVFNAAKSSAKMRMGSASD